MDFEGAEGVRPAHHFLPFDLGADQREVDQFGGGLFVGEVAAGLDRFADLAVEVLAASAGARAPGYSTCIQCNPTFIG